MARNGGGVYRGLDQFRDSCGFGLIASIRGEPSRRLVDIAVESLNSMTHRGGIASDRRTSDGCGVLMQKPDAFLRACCEEALGVAPGRRYAVGTVFLAAEPERARQCRQQLEAQLRTQGFTPLGWRPVPVERDACGPVGRANLPRIEQVFANAPDQEEPLLEARLFVARRRAEMALAGEPDFYVCSLSTRLLSYKALVMPGAFTDFFPDLRDTRLATAVCIFHLRYSTNTVSRWSLAQPFRLLAHNGEINTIWGNRRWADARQPLFQSPLLAELPELGPLVNRHGSDSSSLDNMLEALLAGGMDLYRAIRLVMPPAWQHRQALAPDVQAFFEYNAMHMEPWDGPAGVVMTDGTRAVCMLDRNGLRPSRYVITHDGLIAAASEVGIFSYRPDQVLRKGRIGPGGILAVDTAIGKVFDGGELDQALAASHPYREWLHNHARDCVMELEKELELALLTREERDHYLKLFQLDSEEQQQVLLPLVETGQEAIGAMGDDTPMAVLSTQVRPLYDYFRQQFAQVTNPAIDPLRETLVMSLETCLGAECNVFGHEPAYACRLRLKSPLLSPAMLERLRAESDPAWRSGELSLCYDPGRQGLEQALLALCDEAVALARDRRVVLVLCDRFPGAPDRRPIHALLATGAVHVQAPPGAHKDPVKRVR